MTTGAEANKVLTTDASGVASWQTPAAGGIPSGAVMYFNLTSCPSGWTELTGARGRYLVGLPSGGTLAGTQGTALNNLENRPVGAHTHDVTDPGHSHTGGYSTGAWAQQGANTLVGQSAQTGLSYTGISIQSTGAVAGTNAPYLQLLVCQKN